jgi:hypothetical protein
MNKSKKLAVILILICVSSLKGQYTNKKILNGVGPFTIGKTTYGEVNSLFDGEIKVTTRKGLPNLNILSRNNYNSYCNNLPEVIEYDYSQIKIGQSKVLESKRNAEECAKLKGRKYVTLYDKEFKTLNIGYWLNSGVIITDLKLCFFQDTLFWIKLNINYDINNSQKDFNYFLEFNFDYLSKKFDQKQFDNILENDSISNLIYKEIGGETFRKNTEFDNKSPYKYIFASKKNISATYSERYSLYKEVIEINEIKKGPEISKVYQYFMTVNYGILNIHNVKTKQKLDDLKLMLDKQEDEAEKEKVIEKYKDF